MSSWSTANPSHKSARIVMVWAAVETLIRARPARTQYIILQLRGSFAAHVCILSSIPALPSMQNRALQTRAQPTPSWRCTRAVCGVSSKQNPLHLQTPCVPETKRLFHVQAQAAPCPSLPTSHSWRLGVGRSICVSTISHDRARNWNTAAAAVIAAPASLLDRNFGALGRGSRGGG